MRIVLDGMGGDNAPKEIVKGAVQASREIDHEICIVGDENRIQSELKKYKYDSGKIKIIHSEEVIENDDAPVKAIRRKKKSSMVMGLQMVKDNEGDLFISAGNSGALLAGSLFVVGRIQGIDRPALASTFPVIGENRISLLIDSGANSDCKPNNLLEFATMGSIYMEKVMGVENPKVALVNVGVEETKGSTIIKGAYELLKKSQEEYGEINFIGNMEARDVPNGVCDVMVCDGFVGNVILKLAEGLAWKIMKVLKRTLTSSGLAKFAALLIKGKLDELKGEFDYSEYGGAAILGVKGPIIKIHGSSSAYAVKMSIIKGVPFVENKVVETIESSVLELGEIYS